MLKQTLLTLTVCAVTLLAISQPAHAQIREFKITASDGATDDLFGHSVSISGDYAVVGAIGDDDKGSRSGSAYVYKRSGTSWVEEAKLLPDDGAADDQFGISVSIDDDYAVAGAFGDDVNGDFSGSAYVFKRSGTTWAQEDKLLPTDAAEGDQFGRSVSISGNNTVVGALFHDDNGDFSGSAYLFGRSGTSWSQEAILLASDGAADDEFGGSVSIDGDYAIVGTQNHDDNGTESGAAYLYGFCGPFITGIIDVPHDQGGWVTLNWDASCLDVNVNNLPYYSIWRALPVGTVLANSAMSAADITADFAGEAYRIESFGGNHLAFEWIANQPAHRLAMYSYTAPTLYDFSAATDGKHYFIVSAHTNDPDVFFDSQIDSGYSVDNLVPVPPMNLAGTLDPNAAVVELHWNPNGEEDLSHYLLYRSTTPNIDPDVVEPISKIEDTLFVDSDLPLSDVWYYTLVAEDIHNNRSDKSNEISFMIVGVEGETGAVPNSFKLSQNYPNPFNPETVIGYALPIRSDVKLTIYNLRGEEVALLVDGTVSAGNHRVSWDASGFASGIYFYKIQAGDFVQTRKMLLLK